MNTPTHLTHSGHAGHQPAPAKCHHGPHGPDGCHTSGPVDDALKDPVCGMAVTRQSPHHAEHAGRPYWFCSAGCRTKFLSEPQKYLTPVPTAAEPAAAAAEGTIYT